MHFQKIPDDTRIHKYLNIQYTIQIKDHSIFGFLFVLPLYLILDYNTYFQRMDKFYGFLLLRLKELKYQKANGHQQSKLTMIIPRNSSSSKLLLLLLMFST